MTKLLDAADLWSFEKYYAGSRVKDIKCQGQGYEILYIRCEFFVGVWGKLPKKILYFYLGKRYLQHSETMKQQITPGLGKTKGNISEIWYGGIFKAQSIDLGKRHISILSTRNVIWTLAGWVGVGGIGAWDVSRWKIVENFDSLIEIPNILKSSIQSIQNPAFS